jgi:hypothetical protein
MSHPTLSRASVLVSVLPALVIVPQLSKLVLGAIEHGVPLAHDADMGQLLQAVGKHFHIAAR